MGAADDAPIRVLMITTGWPTPGKAQTTHFIARQVEYLRAAGVDVDVFRFIGQKSLWNYAKAWVRVRRKLATGRYDVVHAQWGQSGLLALPKRLPLVVTFRGCDLHGIVDGACRPTLVGRFLSVLSRMVARRADEAIVVSEHMKGLMDRAGPTHVIPSGLDLALFRPLPRDEARRHLGLSPSKRLVLFAGNPAESRKRFALARLRRPPDEEHQPLVARQPQRRARLFARHGAEVVEVNARGDDVGLDRGREVLLHVRGDDDAGVGRAGHHPAQARVQRAGEHVPAAAVADGAEEVAAAEGDD